MGNPLEKGAVTQFRRREARLKPEFAHLYPPLEAGRWDSAGMMADRMVAWLLRQPNLGYIAPERALRPEHFDFRRGGEQPRSGEWLHDFYKECGREVVFEHETLPKIQRVALKVLMQATGLSKGACSLIRRGIVTPHVRHWAVLASSLR